MINQPRFIAYFLTYTALSLGPSEVFAQFIPGPEYYNQAALATINVLPAYKAGLSGAGVRLGLIDSGINPNHLEFANAIVAAYDTISKRSGSSDFSSFLHDNPDYLNHGSFTSSVAAARLDGAARANNLQGVAYNSDIVIGTMDFSPGYFDRISAAFDYVSSQSAKVINNSWDTAEHIGNPALDYQTMVDNGPALISAIKSALDRGSVIVFTTGNNAALTPATPAVLPSFDQEIAAKGGFIVVGASTIDGTQLADYSNRCSITKAYCIIAPGGSDIDGHPPAEQGVLGVNGMSNSGYFYQAGTSAAAPIVSGAVALVAEQLPWMTNKNLATTLLTTASRAANPDDEWGRGLLNVGKAINGPAIFETDFSANVTAGYVSAFSNDISGPAGLQKLGTGTLILSGNNTYSGDTYLNGGNLVVYHQANLGHSTNALQFNGGTLKFAADFSLKRALIIGPAGGTLDTGNYTLIYSGGEISGSGTLSFIGQPLSLGSNLKLNSIWNANLFVPATLSLQGNGHINGDLTIAGTLSPGNSPGTLSVDGSALSLADSRFVVEIDGNGTGIGAGNHDRLVLKHPSSTYTAGGTLAPILRGISGAANNTYQPAMGQGFQFVSAPGGVLGEFSHFIAPDAGLLPNTRFDLIYGQTALTLYATPASYADISANGMPNNANRRQVGSILESIRPALGIREKNIHTKQLFDSLAEQNQSTLPISMDQLAGVAYAQLIGMNFENTRFLTEQTMNAVAKQRRGANRQSTEQTTNDLANNDKKEIWTMALGRTSRWKADHSGYRLTDTLGGIMGGVQKHIDAKTLAGFSLAYTVSDPKIAHNMGSGPMQSVQLTAYTSHSFDHGFFLQGALGGGASRITAKRPISMLGSHSDAQINSANVSLSALTGWASGDHNSIQYEASFGLNYLAMHHFGFKDNGSNSLSEIRAKAMTHHTFSGSVEASLSMPFQANEIDWRISSLVGLSHEFSDPRITLDAHLLEQPYRVVPGTVGRNRLNLGLGLIGYVAKQTRIEINLSQQSAHHWNTTAANLSMHLTF